MENRCTALNAEKAMSLLEELQECVETMKKCNSIWMGDFQAAADKCSPANWIGEVQQVGTGIDSRTTESSGLCNDMKDNLRRFANDFQEATDMRLGLDI